MQDPGQLPSFEVAKLHCAQALERHRSPRRPASVICLVRAHTLTPAALRPGHLPPHPRPDLAFRCQDAQSATDRRGHKRQPSDRPAARCLCRPRSRSCDLSPSLIPPASAHTADRQLTDSLVRPLSRPENCEAWSVDPVGVAAERRGRDQRPAEAQTRRRCEGWAGSGELKHAVESCCCRLGGAGESGAENNEAHDATPLEEGTPVAKFDRHLRTATSGLHAPETPACASRIAWAR